MIAGIYIQHGITESSIYTGKQFDLCVQAKVIVEIQCDVVDEERWIAEAIAALQKELQLAKDRKEKRTHNKTT